MGFTFKARIESTSIAYGGIQIMPVIDVICDTCGETLTTETKIECPEDLVCDCQRSPLTQRDIETADEIIAALREMKEKRSV